MSINKQQKELSRECIPSSTEMAFVDNAMKEWAKTGQMTKEQAKDKLGREPCGGAFDDPFAATTRGTYFDCYSTDVLYGDTPGIDPKYNIFAGPGNDGMVWAGFPKSGLGYYCKDGMGMTCSARDRINVTDVNDIFNMIDFGPADSLPAEATRAANRLVKVESCSSSKLSMRKRAMWGEFLKGTVENLGQPVNTGSIMDVVTNITSSGGAGVLQSLPAIATQFLAK
jgi:hypothetical protein